MSIKSLLNHWLENRTVRVCIPGNLDTEQFDDEGFEKSLEQSEIEALFQSVLQEEQRDARAVRSVRH